MHDAENKDVKMQETHVSRIYASKEAPKGFSTIQVAKYCRSAVFQLERWEIAELGRMKMAELGFQIPPARFG